MSYVTDTAGGVITLHFPVMNSETTLQLQLCCHSRYKGSSVTCLNVRWAAAAISWFQLTIDSAEVTIFYSIKDKFEMWSENFVQDRNICADRMLMLS